MISEEGRTEVGDVRPRAAAGRTAGLRALILGAGQAGRTIARDLRRAPEFGLIPVGFLDDHVTSENVQGLPVLGRIDEMAAVAIGIGAEVAVVAMPSIGPREVKRLGEAAASAGLGVRYLPSFIAALERDARVTDLQHMRLDRLLGRHEVRVVRRTTRTSIEGKRVLVTGAGGSIGSELCRQLARFTPAALHLLDHDESNLHRLHMQLTGNGLLDGDELIIADIRDKARMRQLFARLRPEVVFHAAAHKHLPLLEKHPSEAVKSNVLGTKNLVDAALATGTDRFILISTDKAADPTSILGATKRVAEMVLQAAGGSTTRFASVRFGNVLGSRGSFLSVLSEQFQNGNEVTVTDPDVTRFFMTVEEAVGLVIEAGEMASSGETFVLDMGQPVKIVDLVHNYARELQLSPEDVSIRYTGLRPGEKLEESLFSENEESLPTQHPRIWAIRPKDAAVLNPEKLNDLLEAAAQNHDGHVRAGLAALVPFFTYDGPTTEPRGAGLYPDDY